ncbi:MAG: hypothetical protein ABI679_01875 [Gemmatimonadota bacterium]
MSSPIGMAEYFAMESGEYLDRLNAIVSHETAPPPEEMVRFARALRGSALMANQPVVARTAAGLEAVAKAYRENRRPWDASLRDRCLKAVTDLRALVRTAGKWSDEESTRAERLALDLESLGGVTSPAGPRPTPPPSGAPGTDAGVRAFVAREGALTASALDRAARALRTSPEGHEPLYAVLRRLQSLRGLAALTDLAPLPDVLESVERAVGELTRMFAPPPYVADVFEAAAQALARGSRDVAQSGRPSPDADEPRRFAELLLKAFATESDVVPIESLYSDGQNGLVKAGTVVRESPLTTVELVSQGERLCEVADELDRATTPTLRDLRLYAMVAALRPLETATGDQIPHSLAAFAGAARELIAQGGVARSTADFATCVRETGAVLRSLATPSADTHPGDQIEALAQRLHRMGAPVFRPVHFAPVPDSEPASAPLPKPAPPRPSLPAFSIADERDVVPIESLAPDEVAPPPVSESRAAPAPTPVTPPQDQPGLEGSYLTLSRLVRARPMGSASLEELLDTSRWAKVAPIDTESDVVQIDELCYRGRGAVERAALVRREMNSVLASGVNVDLLRPLLDELQDLVSLAQVPS